MSTSKFSNSWRLPSRPESDNISAIANHLSDITNSLIPVFQNRVTVGDNLNMEYKTVQVVSGKEFILNSSKISRIVGVKVIDTASCTVTSEKISILANDKVKIVLEYTADKNSNPMTFLILGE